MHPIKSNNFTLTGLFSMEPFQNFCIINFTDVHFNFQLCLFCCTSTWRNNSRWECWHISKSVVRLSLSGLENRTRESVSHSDVTFEDAITAVAESNLLITWRVQRWAVCEINLMLSVTRRDKMPVFLEHSRIGRSSKVKQKREETESEWSEWNFQNAKSSRWYVLHIVSDRNTNRAPFVMPALQEKACWSWCKESTCQVSVWLLMEIVSK